MTSPSAPEPGQTTRVRFAPSPTGHLHVGGARTAIYNWLFARHTHGRFILRIDDTDPQRSSDEFTEAILRGMRWLGLDWDEGPEAGGEFGPYFQGQRAERYTEAAERLLASGAAYECYCTPDELERKREEALRAKSFAGYDRACRQVPEADRARHRQEGVPRVIRFAVPLDGETAFDDGIRGRLTVTNENIEDFVIIRGDGSPTYNFASTVDDAQMLITHVIRGDDHMSNTPKQILLLEALGEPVPTFAHLPMIWGSDRTRLSKRHGATSVESYREEGYMPEALLNFLALLGWSPGSEETLLSRDELVALFTLDRVASSPAIFDADKLDWMNGQYVRGLSNEEFVARGRPFLQRAGLIAPQADEEQAAEAGGTAGERMAAWWDTLAEITRERVEHFDQWPALVSFLFGDIRIDEAAAAKALADAGCARWLETVATTLEVVDPFEATAVEEAIRGLPETLGVKPKALFQAVRVAVTGTMVSPPLFESIVLLGKEESIARLASAARFTCPRA
jgi:glutamyl-tRNA synthetase